MSRRTRRKIHLSSGIWEYFISSRLTVLIWSPAGEKHVADTRKLTGCSWDEIERGQRKGTSSGRIHPRQVKAYIEAEVVRRRHDAFGEGSRTSSGLSV